MAGRNRSMTVIRSNQVAKQKEYLLLFLCREGYQTIDTRQNKWNEDNEV